MQEDELSKQARKEEIRKIIRAKREQISMIQATELSARVAEQVLRLPEYKMAGKILCYASVPGEVTTGALNARILADGKQLYLPRVLDATTIEVVPVTDLSTLRASRMRILEPTVGEGADPRELDMVIVPGIAFDLRGGRIGFGGGYYDRLLAGLPALRVALSYEMQIISDALSTRHDVRMHMIISEKRVYRVSRYAPANQ